MRRVGLFSSLLCFREGFFYFSGYGVFSGFFIIKVGVRSRGVVVFCWLFRFS